MVAHKKACVQTSTYNKPQTLLNAITYRVVTERSPLVEGWEDQVFRAVAIEELAISRQCSESFKQVLHGGTLTWADPQTEKIVQTTESSFSTRPT
eukprot:2185186-Amphidinium_carterae.1